MLKRVAQRLHMSDPENTGFTLAEGFLGKPCIARIIFNEQRIDDNGISHLFGIR